MNKDKVIEKMKELIEVYDYLSIPNDYRTKINRLKSKLQALESEPDEPIYTLNCDKCEKSYQSIKAFPKPQLCKDCEPRGLFEKVYIKSEADLPEEDGEYLSFTKGHRFTNFTYSTKFPDHMIGRIDWYLRPIKHS